MFSGEAFLYFGSYKIFIALGASSLLRGRSAAKSRDDARAESIAGDPPKKNRSGLLLRVYKSRREEKRVMDEVV